VSQLLVISIINHRPLQAIVLPVTDNYNMPMKAAECLYKSEQIGTKAFTKSVCGTAQTVLDTC